MCRNDGELRTASRRIFLKGRSGQVFPEKFEEKDTSLMSSVAALEKRTSSSGTSKRFLNSRVSISALLHSCCRATLTSMSSAASERPDGVDPMLEVRSPSENIRM